MDELDILVKKLAKNEDAGRFEIFRASVQQKFWSLDTYKSLLLSINPISLPVFGGNGEASTGTVSTNISDIEEFKRFINMYFDGFVMNSKSSLDSLAHVANILYPVYSTSEEIYFNKEFIDKVENKFSSNKFFNKIKDVSNQQWLKDLQDFRNVTTHERLIEAKIISEISTANKGNDFKIFLPDNIKASKLTWNGINELYPFCDKLESSIGNLLNEAKGAMIEDLKSCNKIPIV